MMPTLYVNITAKSSPETAFLVVAAGVIIAICILRLILEAARFIYHVNTSQLGDYITDLANWVELPLFICTVLFTTVYHRECLCPRGWQWQVGIVAVFLAWTDLVLYMRKLRLLGGCFY